MKNGILAFGGIFFFVGAIALSFVNNMAFTETRAQENVSKFIIENSLEVTRKTCAGDSDGDGYGTCVVALEGGERIKLNCPVDWFTVSVLGADGCKEVFTDTNWGLQVK
tara:strand:- start:20 stop:346 length:327 start_codon:yes stop_codon:yes gene_type:complete